MRQLRLGSYSLGLATDFGPRVVSFSFEGGPNLFASLDDDVTLPHPEGNFVFRGGHRLWAAPEIPTLTYAPDESPCEISSEAGTTTMRAPTDAAGLTKAMSVAEDDPGISVTHNLTNNRHEPLRVAPWAITQFPLGGQALMPLPPQPEKAPQADRRLVLWPYTSPADPRLRWASDHLVVDCRQQDSLKIGALQEMGRLGYFNMGVLFTKTFDSQSDQTVDHGSNAQIFAGEHFAELESLGSRSVLAPGESVSHREQWTVQECDDLVEAVQIMLET